MLTTDERRHYVNLLEERERKLAAELEAVTDSSKPVELDQALVGRLSRMDAMQQQGMAIHLRARLENERTQVQAALARIGAGTFGTCTACGQVIDAKRLECMPESPVCMNCHRQSR